MMTTRQFALLERVFDNEQFDHKRHYADFRQMQMDGYVDWTLGHAFITEKGTRMVLGMRDLKEAGL